MKKFTIILFLLAVHTASAFSQTGRQKDSLALVTLYDSLGGANWTTKTNWRTNTAISTWYGVTLDTILQRVTSLVLGNNNLQGILPQRIGNIDSLTQLDLAQNKINGIIPDTLYHLIRLSTVYLNFQNTNGFGISGTISPKIGQLQRLQILYLYTNKISGTIPPEIGNCKKLMSLDLGNNLLTGSIPVELGDLFFLQSLGLSSNVLSGTIPDLSGCASLSTINLSTNRLTGKIHPSIWTRTNLFSLTLNDNRLSPDSIPSAIGNLTNLDYLQLINDSLIGEIPAALSNCTKLRGIFLTGNSLSGRVPDLSAFNLLQFLWIDRNRFDSLQNLTPLPVLSDLEINNNRFDFNDIEPNVGAATTFTYSGQDSLGAGTTITLPVGAPMTLSVSPGGTANSYQWTKNNIDIGGA